MNDLDDITQSSETDSKYGDMVYSKNSPLPSGRWLRVVNPLPLCLSALVHLLHEQLRAGSSFPSWVLPHSRVLKDRCVKLVSSRGAGMLPVDFFQQLVETKHSWSWLSFCRAPEWHLRAEEFTPPPNVPLKHGPGPMPEVLAADLPQQKALRKSLGK